MFSKAKKMNKLNTATYLAIALMVVIIINSFGFHYPIHIIDMMTDTPQSDFGIHISIWKILFEPILGPLLYFNRGYYGIAEINHTLYWTIGIFILTRLSKILTDEYKKHWKQNLIRAIVDLPIVAFIWFTIFIIMLFIPLPNNTIINNTTSQVLVTTHAHAYYSHDGLTSPEGLWRWHKRNGFDAYFETDHNNHNRTLDFIAQQREKDIPIHPLIMCGEEFSGSNHLSLLGLKRKFSNVGMPDSVVIDSTHQNGGVVIVNHWFDDKHNTLEYYRDLGVDGFEIENTGKDIYYDRALQQEIQEFCTANDLIMVGGLDFHGYGNVCMMWNAFDIPNWNKLDPISQEYAIINILKSRDQSKLKILLYKDRPYYDKSNLWFRPLLTFINYFRTLNYIQVLSWLLWIIIIFLLNKILVKNKSASKFIGRYKILKFLGVISVVFTMTLGLYYRANIQTFEGFSDIYAEYSAMLLYVGIAGFLYLILDMVITKRLKKKRK